MATGDNRRVAPFPGAWIETEFVSDDRRLQLVAPFPGAWIETFVILMRCVICIHLSRPSRARGLKLAGADLSSVVGQKSRPSRARGLKLVNLI